MKKILILIGSLSIINPVITLTESCNLFNIPLKLNERSYNNYYKSMIDSLNNDFLGVFSIIFNKFYDPFTGEYIKVSASISLSNEEKIIAYYYFESIFNNENFFNTQTIIKDLNKNNDLNYIQKRVKELLQMLKTNGIDQFRKVPQFSFEDESFTKWSNLLNKLN